MFVCYRTIIARRQYNPARLSIQVQNDTVNIELSYCSLSAALSPEAYELERFLNLTGKFRLLVVGLGQVRVDARHQTMSPDVHGTA